MLSAPAAGAASADELDAVGRRVLGPPTSPFGVPGVLLAVRAAGQTRVVALGHDGAGREMARDRLFPLASATKLATGLLVLRLIEDGALALDGPVGDVLPDAAAAAVTVRALLCHRGGLPLDLPPDVVDDAQVLDWRRLAGVVLRTPPRQAPWGEVSYSNVGYGLLALAAERVTGWTFRDALHRLVLDPMGLDTIFAADAPERTIAITDVRSPLAGTDRDPYNSAHWRCLGLPWAGLAATPDALLDLLDAYRSADGPTDGAGVIRPETAALATTDHAESAAGGFPGGEALLGFHPGRPMRWAPCAWGLSVELRGDKRPHWTPAAASPRSFGQIGSSGCLAWHDPEAGASWAVLGARSTESGWLLRHGPALGTAALAAAARMTRGAPPHPSSSSSLTADDRPPDERRGLDAGRAPRAGDRRAGV